MRVLRFSRTEENNLPKTVASRRTRSVHGEDGHWAASGGDVSFERRYRSIERNLPDPKRGSDKDDDIATASWTIIRMRRSRAITGRVALRSRSQDRCVIRAMFPTVSDREEIKLVLEEVVRKRKQTCRTRFEHSRRQFAGLFK